MTLLCLVIFLWWLWGMYVLVMGLYRAHLDKRLTTVTYILSAPFLLVGVVMDIFANIFLATIVFAEIPREWMVTQRLSRLLNNHDWRGSLARAVCTGLLDLFDPTGKHCK